MGKQLVWNDRYNIGVEIIDKEHKKLFRIMNKLFAFSEEDLKSRWVCQEGIKYFKDHTLKHFAEEEEYMDSIQYENFETHRNIHRDFRTKTLPALERELEQEDYSAEAINHFLGVCAGWLIGHTLTEDQAIMGRGISKWGELLPGEEQAAMQNTIIQLLNRLFLLDAKAISASYGGEKFGSGIYYRLVYGSQEGVVWEIILVFEEKLLIDTVGRVIGSESSSVDAMIINATRYTARQFLDYIGERFIGMELHAVKSENLLTYDQFKKNFDEHRPKYSLLFDTGEGYFAYCAIARNAVSDKVGVSIKAENAMEGIEQYLKKNEEAASGKKKILVVDDSKMIRCAMKELLEPDYEIALAQSGVAAIQCIALNRPDLILLDYEMPVVSGKQVLEMIRSEKDFADIDVFFLTGRVDRESIVQILPLNPAGYLSKNLNPADIKKNIDLYFEKKKEPKNRNNV